MTAHGSVCPRPRGLVAHPHNTQSKKSLDSSPWPTQAFSKSLSNAAANWAGDNPTLPRPSTAWTNNKQLVLYRTSGRLYHSKQATEAGLLSPTLTASGP